jgi:hypothetical protein
VDPLAMVDVNDPGVIDTLVVPLVDHVSLVLVPPSMIAGFATNELIFNCEAVTTVTVSVAVLEPFALVAVIVYVVVALGLTLTVPVSELDLNPPGLIEMLVVLVVTQLSVLFEPSKILGGLALNELIIGFGGTVSVTFTVFVTVPALFFACRV